MSTTSRAISDIERTIRERAEAHPGAVWLKWRDETFTWADTLSCIQRTANGLLELGVRPGDVLAIMAGNRPEFLWAHFAAMMIGASSVPINISQRGPTLEHILSDSAAAAVIFQEDLRGVLLSAKDRCPSLGRTVVLDGATGPGVDRTFDQVMDAPDREPEIDVAEPATGAAIMYTSGTTGPPKGVVTVRRDPDQGAFLKVLSSLGVRAGETMFTALPLFHGNALYVSVLGSILLDAKLALAERFSASRVWDTCRRYDVVTFNTLGGMIPILLKQAQKESDADNPVRVVLDAGCPSEQWGEFGARFGVRLVEWYGMVDAPGYLLNDGGPVGSIGKPVGGVEFRTVDVDDAPVGAGRVGELVFRNPSGLLTQYHKRQDATEEAYRDGWFHTGDLAEQDAEGWFYFRGRKKASIRRLGENISAWEIETVLNQHPDVMESAAFAVQSELSEDEVAVAIVARPGVTLQPERVIEYCVGNMAKHAVPRYVFFVTELPKTATQRVQYGVLREQGLPRTAWDRQAERTT